MRLKLLCLVLIFEKSTVFKKERIYFSYNLISGITIRQLVVISFLGVSEDKGSFLVWHFEIKARGQVELSG